MSPNTGGPLSGSDRIASLLMLPSSGTGGFGLGFIGLQQNLNMCVRMEVWVSGARVFAKCFGIA